MFGSRTCLATWDNKLFTWCTCTHFGHMSLFLLPTQLSAGSGRKPLQEVTAWNSNSPLGGVTAWVKLHNNAHTEHPPHLQSLIASPTTRWLTAQCTYTQYFKWVEFKGTYFLLKVTYQKSMLPRTTCRSGLWVKAEKSYRRTEKNTSFARSTFQKVSAETHVSLNQPIVMSHSKTSLIHTSHVIHGFSTRVGDEQYGNYLQNVNILFPFYLLFVHEEKRHIIIAYLIV